MLPLPRAFDILTLVLAYLHLLASSSSICTLTGCFWLFWFSIPCWSLSVLSAAFRYGWMCFGVTWSSAADASVDIAYLAHCLIRWSLLYSCNIFRRNYESRRWEISHMSLHSQQLFSSNLCWQYQLQFLYHHTLVWGVLSLLHVFLSFCRFVLYMAWNFAYYPDRYSPILEVKGQRSRSPGTQTCD